MSKLAEVKDGSASNGAELRAGGRLAIDEIIDDDGEEGWLWLMPCAAASSGNCPEPPLYHFWLMLLPSNV